MYSSILVPLDGSEVAASVLPYVTNLAQRLQARVTLLTVVAPARSTARDGEAGALADAQDRGRRLARHLADAGIEADTLVVPGQPAERIVTQAQEGRFDIIAIGTRGHSGIRRGLLGSVTDEVVRTSPVPVLVLSPGAVERSAQDDYELSSVTVPLDGSELAESVLPYAEGLAQQVSLEMHLLRIVSIGPLITAGGMHSAYVDTAPIEEDLVREATAYLNKVAQRLTERGLTASCTVEKRYAALAIADHLRDMPCNLVAICTRGRSGLGRMIIGSVADSIIRSASVPVLVITPRGSPQE